MAEALLLKFSIDDVHRPQPWPVAINTDGTVRSGLGPDDGAHLMGFGPAGEQSITVFPIAAWENPAAVVGMTATFSKDDGLFLWNLPISEATRIGTP